ncbi:MAG: hypothetical protein HC836_40070, partial [Richelia sp. RM2_1_2]|nr:hypothetical protein [Richelia sp. RM2_1_2]
KVYALSAIAGAHGKLNDLTAAQTLLNKPILLLHRLMSHLLSLCLECDR